MRAVTLNARIRSTGAIKPSAPVDPRKLATSFNQSTRSSVAWTDGERATTGRGVAVAVVDTGIDGSHPDFQRADGSGSRVVASPS